MDNIVCSHSPRTHRFTQSFPISLNTFKSNHSHKSSLPQISPIRTQEVNKELIILQEVKLPYIAKSPYQPKYKQRMYFYLRGNKKRIEEKSLKTSLLVYPINKKVKKEIAMGTDSFDNDSYV